jgi:hypothetical protein
MSLTREELIKKMKEDFNGCPLFEDREKGDLNDLDGEILTIADYFPMSEYHAVVFEEHDDKVYLSGGGLKKLLTEYGKEDVRGIKIKMLPLIKTKAKRDYRPIEVIG